MAGIIDVQRLYSDIIIRGRRNAPTYNEVRRDAATVARRDSVSEIRF